MAKYSSKDVAFLLLGGYSLLGFQTSLRYSVEAVTEQTDTLGDTWEEHETVGMSRASMEQDGFFDDATNGNNAALVTGATTGPGSERVLSLGLAGNVVGRLFTGFAGAMQMVYERITERAAMHRANAQMTGVGQAEEGRILFPLSTVSGATSGNNDASSIDNGASSAAGGSAYFQFTALTLGGGTNFAATVRHSVDNVSFAALVTSTVITAAPAAERKTVAGTVNRYLSGGWLFGGSPTGQSATIFVGFKRN